jgi:hypothetical protein
LARFEFKSGTVSFCFSFIFVLFGGVQVAGAAWRGVQVAGAAWRAAMRTMAGVGDLVQRTGDGRTCRVLDGRAVERSGGTMCGLHLARGD